MKAVPNDSSKDDSARNTRKTEKAHRHRKRKPIERDSASSPRRDRAIGDFPIETREALEHGRELVLAVERDLWQIADHADLLHSKHGVTFREMESLMGTHSFSRYCVLAKMSREFPKDRRPESMTVSAAEAVLRTEGLKGLEMSREAIAKKVIASKLPARRVRKHFLQDRQKRVVRHTSKSVARLISKSGDAFDDRARLGDYRERCNDIADRSVAVMLTDPPFAQYDRTQDGRYDPGRSGSGLREECDFDNREDARAVTEDLFPVAERVLRPGGTLLIFQPGLKPPQQWLFEAAKRSNLQCHYMLTWPKQLSQPTDFDHAYTYSSERVYVFARPEEVPHDHSDGSVSRSEILHGHPAPTQSYYAKIQSGDLAPGQMHKYQKPISLLEHLIRKHSYEQELILDIFGCSASASIGAIKLKREWIYFEHNQSNFEFGVSRIQMATEGRFDELV